MLPSYEYVQLHVALRAVIAMSWYECGQDYLGRIVGLKDKLYICLQNNGLYSWEDITLLRNLLIIVLLVLLAALVFRKTRSKKKSGKRKR